MKTIIGKKISMTQIFSSTGELIPVTAIEVEDNIIVDIKTLKKNGYNSFLIAYQDTLEKKLSKPLKSIFLKKNIPFKKKLIEISCNETEINQYKIGDSLKVENLFSVGDFVDIQGKTKGFGFTGAVKLWNFSIGPRSHGAGWPHRYQGSLQSGRGGSSAQRVFKGKKMAARYGNEKSTVLKLEIVSIISEKKIIFVKGSVPGRSNYLLRIRETNRSKKKSKKPFVINQVNNENNNNSNKD